jgi:hypothetical protein
MFSGQRNLWRIKYSADRKGWDGGGWEGVSFYAVNFRFVYPHILKICLSFLFLFSRIRCTDRVLSINRAPYGQLSCGVKYRKMIQLSD